ncbi:ribonuclease HII [Rhodovulum sp. ES.010]|uniref:ribonuclease HII n=1 Tax=Rhodovulum sp. ES.010 TaxID=1882821 RepID=UPI000940900B|nr:ribonuclease HII [Rhodovulum sp. ES.010]
MPRPAADFALEEQARAAGARVIVGVDEVGRGPLAGPVTAAAVRLDISAIPEGLADSKRLTAARRRALADALHAAAEVSIAHASVEEIDRLNILRASHLAMCRALGGLPRPADFALVDGNLLPEDLPCPGLAVVGGDGLCLSIAAASIVAKVARDALMVELAQHFPGYGWETNAGYPTKAHRRALRDIGVSPHHRRSFAPVHNILYQAKTVSG